MCIYMQPVEGSNALNVPSLPEITRRRGTVSSRYPCTAFTRNFDMASKPCKLFVGGLNVRTDNEGLRKHFQQYGALTDCVLILNRNRSRSCCFGFITYATPEEADAALAVKPHVVDGNTVDLKRAIACEDTKNLDVQANVKKIFVGGVKNHVEAENLTEYFSQFGAVEKAEIISDKQTGKKRGFGFVYFEDCDSATKAAIAKFHTIDGNKVEVKKVLTKQELATKGRGRGRGMQNYGGGRGGYHSSGYGEGYAYGTGYNGAGGYDGSVFIPGYGQYNCIMGGASAYSMWMGYGWQASGYGPIKGAIIPTGVPRLNRGGATAFGSYGRGRGGGFGSSY